MRLTRGLKKNRIVSFPFTEMKSKKKKNKGEKYIFDTSDAFANYLLISLRSINPISTI